MRKFCIALQNFFYTIFHNHNFESYFHSLEVVLNQLIETSNSSQVLNGIPLIKSFLTDLLKTETLDFEGDPTQGLQIMGLLETRMLDFDRVIVTHLNEGQLPAGNRINSFLPFEVKKEFGNLKNVKFSKSIQDSIKDSDLIIIHTEWNDFKSINFKNFIKGKKFIIFDMRNIYSSTKIEDQGFKYYRIGK